MSVMLRDLVKQVEHIEMKLVAGKGGYSNPVEWVHMVDTAEIAEFLVGGEVAFTTGVGIREDMSLLHLIESVYKNKASAIVINVGPYVPEITQDVIDFGNEHDFPVFEVPWHVHMAEIMRMFCFTITKSEQKAMELSAAFRYAIAMPLQEELYVSTLMQKGYFAEWDYITCILEICDRLPGEKGNTFYAPVSNERLAIFLKKAARILTAEKHDAAVFFYNDRIAVVFSDITEEKAVYFMEKVKSEILNLLKTTEALFMSVGSVSHNIRSVYKSYHIAKKIIDLSKIEYMEKEIRTYSSLGMLSLLFHIEEPEVLDEYYNKTIKPLADYDAHNDSNLLEVLECYVKNNGSVQDTAEELFVHRNTINYKMKKIESLLQTDINRFDVRNELTLGIMVEKIRKFPR